MAIAKKKKAAPTEDTGRYTNNPRKAENKIAGLLAHFKVWFTLVAASITGLALLASFLMAAADVVTGGHFSATIAGFTPTQGIASVVGIDLAMLATLAMAAWAGKVKKYGTMAMWYLASIPSLVMAYIQLRVFTLEQVGHMNETAAFHTIGMNPLQYADWRMGAAFILMIIEPWIATETWHRVKRAPVKRVNGTEVLHARPTRSGRPGGKITQFRPKQRAG